MHSSVLCSALVPVHLYGYFGEWDMWVRACLYLQTGCLDETRIGGNGVCLDEAMIWELGNGVCLDEAMCWGGV